MDDSKDFDDPFSYKPLKRKKKSAATLASQKSKTPKPTQKKSAKPTQKKSAKKISPKPSQSRVTQTSPAKRSLPKSPPKKKTPEKSVDNSQWKKISPWKNASPGKQLSIDLFTNKENNQNLPTFCPICQMPLAILGGIGLESHIASCAEISRSAANPCPDDVECTSKAKHHYTQFSHEELARHRDLGFLELPTEIIDTTAGDAVSINNPRFPTPRRRIDDQLISSRRRLEVQKTTTVTREVQRTHFTSDLDLTCANPTNILSQTGRPELHRSQSRTGHPEQHRSQSRTVSPELHRSQSRTGNPELHRSQSQTGRPEQHLFRAGQPQSRQDPGEREDGAGLEGIDPPVTQSTPVRRRRCISPIQHRRSSQNSSRLNSQHVNQFLNGINHHITDGDIAKGLDRSNGVVMNGINRITDSDIVPGTNSDSLLSESLLARVNRNRDQDNRNRDQDNRNRAEPELGPGGVVNPLQGSGGVRGSGEVVDDEEFYDTIDHIGDDNNDQGKSPGSITGFSQEAGPSGAANHKNPPNPIPKTPVAGDRPRLSGDGRRASVGSSNLRYSETEELCTESPFQIRAVRDSEEMELSLDLNSKVKCSKLRLKIPLKGDGVPVEVSARYSDNSSPSKQAKITSYFNLNRKQQERETEDFEGSVALSHIEDSGGSVVVIKKRKIEAAIAQWGKLLGVKQTSENSGSKSSKSGRNSGERSNGNYGNEELKRKVPFYKKIFGTSLAVDGFNYGIIPGIRYYFLSHFHYDHYIGLSRKWSKPIVCSSLTKRMVVNFLKVDARLVTTLDPGESRLFDNVEVTSVDANHCPGSLMFVFRLTFGTTILHVGDFRADPEMESDPVFWNNKHIDTVYLDTTYCRPEYDFPAQHLVIQHTVHQIDDLKGNYAKIAILVGAYTIGKERIFKGIAEHLDCKVWANAKRLKTWASLEDAEINRRISPDRKSAEVHVVDQRQLSWSGLEKEWEEVKGSFDHILGVKPTGWTHGTGLDPETSLSQIRTKTRGNISYLEVPYSEHSSFSELKRFIQFLRIKSNKQIIPTVNLRDRSRMNSFFDAWIEENQKKGPESQ